MAVFDSNKIPNQKPVGIKHIRPERYPLLSGVAVREAGPRCGPFAGLWAQDHSHATPPADDLVFIAGDFEALPCPLHPHHGYIGQSDLVGGREDRHGGCSQTSGSPSARLLRPRGARTPKGARLFANLHLGSSHCAPGYPTAPASGGALAGQKAKKATKPAPCGFYAIRLRPQRKAIFDDVIRARPQLPLAGE